MLLNFLLLVLACNAADFYVSTRQNNMDYLKSHLLDISNPDSKNYGKFMTQIEIDDIVRTDPEQMTQVIDWLTQNNVRIIKQYSDVIHCRADNLSLNIP